MAWYRSTTGRYVQAAGSPGPAWHSSGPPPQMGKIAGAISRTTPALSEPARLAMEEAMELYEPGGAFGAGIEAGLERGRVKALASGMQSLVSAGLAGTTMSAGLGKKYEEEVAAPTRARMEEIRAGRLSELFALLAGMEQRGYETAQDRALREYLTQLQLGTQMGIAGMRTGLGYTTPETITGGMGGMAPARTYSPGVTGGYTPPMGGGYTPPMGGGLTTEQQAAFELGYGPVSEQYAQTLMTPQIEEPGIDINIGDRLLSAILRGEL